MDDIKIRDYIINNFQGDEISTIKNAIEESIKEQDEVTLPGMGVFFEILWTDSTEEEKNKILNLLKKRFDRESSK